MDRGQSLWDLTNYIVWFIKLTYEQLTQHTDCGLYNLLGHSISIFNEDRNFSATSRPHFIPTNFLCSDCLPRRVNSRSKKLIMPLYLVVILKVPNASHISRALCLIKHNSTKFVFTFLILSCHLCLGPSQNYALQTIMSIICLKEKACCSFRQQFCRRNLGKPAGSNCYFHPVCPSAHLNGTAGLRQHTVL